MLTKDTRAAITQITDGLSRTTGTPSAVTGTGVAIGFAEIGVSNDQVVCWDEVLLPTAIVSADVVVLGASEVEMTLV